MIPNLKFYFFVMIAFSFFTESYVKAQTKEGQQSITIDELKNHMYFLASDFLGGRVSYETGYNIAAEYCSSQFKSMGLETVLKDKNGNPTYFQEVPLIKTTIGKDFSVSLVSSKGTTVLESVTDIKIPGSVKYIPKPELDVVFIGYGIEEPKYKWNDFAKMDISGKAVVFLMGTPKKNGKSILPDSIDKKYQSNPGINAKFVKIFEKKPAICILIPDSETIAKFTWEKLPNYSGSDFYTYSNEISKDNGFLAYGLKPESVKKLFKDQIYTPDNIETNGLKGYKTFQLIDLKLNAIFSVTDHDTIITKNVVGVLKGTDELLNKQYVTVGAHLDHVPRMRGKICNGADDNASGAVGVIELAEAMVFQPPKRSILFALYTSEELGLLGSYHLVSNPPVPLENMVVNLNLDMIGRSDEKNSVTRAHYIESHPEYLESMKNLISEVNSKSVNWPLIYENCEGSLGDSDHSSFNDKGIPNVHFFSGVHKDLHLPTDDAEKIDYEKMQKIINLVYDLTYKCANLEHLPFAKN